MRHAPGKNGRLVDTLLPAPPQRPTSWKNAEFQRAEDDTKMPKLWGTAGKPLQNQQLGNNFPDQFLSLTDWQLNHLKNRTEEHTSELQSLMRNSYAAFCLKKNKPNQPTPYLTSHTTYHTPIQH